MADAQDIRPWAAAAVALTRLPAVGSDVYYFAEGHAEQWSLPVLEAAPSMVACSVVSMDCFTAVEEPYARITLAPANHRNPPAADPRPNPDTYLYFRKALVQADTDRYLLSVPMACAQSLFPMFQDGSTIPMSDVRGETYQFLYRIAHRRELRRDWQRFLDAKRPLGVGDTVVLLRRSSDQQLFIEAGPRRQLFFEAAPVQPGLPPLDELAQASLLAAQGASFTVTWYPGRGSPFVVPGGAVNDAMGKIWESGMAVSLRATDVVLPAGGPQGAAPELVRASINSVNPGIAWCTLQVTIDASGAVIRTNAWDVQAVRAQASAAKRNKPTPAADADDAGPGERKKLRLFGKDIVQ